MEKRASCFLLVITFLCFAWLANCKPQNFDDSRPEPNGGCKCSDNTCGCCQDINLEIVKATACVNITYIPDDLALQITMSWDGKVYINQTVSAKNPPPLCQGLPLAYACVRFYNMSYTAGHLGGCVELEIKLLEKVVIPIGCFYFPNEVKPALESNWEEGSKEVVDQVKELLHKNLGGLITKPSDPCECDSTECSCCADIPLVGEVCVNVTELPKQEAVSFTLSVDGKVYFNETLSAKNPPPFCESDITHLAYICVRFYNMSYSGEIGGCLQLECRVVEPFNISLGCFYFPEDPRKVIADNIDFDVMESLLNEAHQYFKNLMEIGTEDSALPQSSLSDQVSVPRDKIVLNQQICKCKQVKAVDCKCCTPVEGSQACIHLKHAYLKPKMTFHLTVHSSKSHLTLAFPFVPRPCSYWRFKEKHNLTIRSCFKAASRDLSDGSVMSGVCIEMETREPNNYRKYDVGCVYPAVKQQKSRMERIFSPFG